MMSEEIHGRKSQLGRSGTFPARVMFAARDSQKCGSSGYLQTALTALCAAGLFSVLYLIRGFYPFGDGSILITDLYSQYVPLLYRFYDVVTGQKNLFLDFSVSGGANLYVDTINEVLNPFNYVLLLFGRDRLYQAVNVVLLLYVTAAAASADFFLLKMFPKNRKWNVVLSLCYAFSGYMAYNYQIIKWMYFPVLFPLFCLALRRLIREKKGGWYAFLLGYQLVLSVQLGFMTLLFVLFGSGIYFYTCGQRGAWAGGQRGKGSPAPSGGCREGKKEEGRDVICLLGLYTIVGLLLSGAVLLPNIQILLSSSRAGENLSYPGVMKRHGLDDLFERLFQIAHPVLLSLFVWAFAGWRRKKCRFADLPDAGRFLFLLNAFLWLTVLLQPANLLWHMGSYVCFPVRYAYMVLLSGICLTKWLLTMREDEQDDAEGEKRKNMVGRLAPLCAAALCIAACLLTYHFEDRIVQAFSSLAISLMCPKETRVVCVVLLLFFAAGLCSLTGAGGRRTVAGAAALCGLCLNLFIFLPPDYGVRLSNEAAYRKMTQQAAVIQEAAGAETGGVSATEQSDAFGRTAQPQSADSVLHRVKDDPELPLNAALVNRRSTLTGYFPTAGRGFKNAMESLGYLVPWVATRSVGGTAISDEILSMCLLFEQDASKLAFQSDSVLGRQEELSVLVSGKSCLERVMGSSLETDQKGAALLTVAGERTVYLDPGRTADSFRIFVNGKETEVPEAASAFSAHRIVEVGTFQDERAEILVTDQNGTALSPEGMEFGLLDRKAWREKGTRQLTGEELAIDSPGGCIRLSLADAEEGQTVFLPFASLRGWDCILNGKHVDITSVFGGFLGITTSAGGNEIVLKFTPPGLWIGMLLTGLGVIGLAGGAVWDRSHGKRDGSRLETAVRALYGIALAAGLLAVYVIPAAGLICYLAGKVLGIF